MTDLTSGLESIVGLLKDEDYGVGTSGYEITDDNDTELTIDSGNILVQYSMSKEELRDIFGSTSDVDIIITCKHGDTEDKFIGLNTKQWKEQVIIEANIIEKHSAVGSGYRYITPDLVRYKTVNALRNFIEDNTNSPRGTINRWKFVGLENSEDTTTKPTLYKAKITTEALMFYSTTI